ncbi:hypothetical protein KBC03_04650 [Patescibacteria group bacterium]|nr:hypothetical protein [Patescibacteria group bacterium]
MVDREERREGEDKTNLYIAHELNIDLDQAFAKMLESDKQKIEIRK